MKRQEKLKWFENEFWKINKLIEENNFLSLSDFLRIRNFKLQNSTTENEENINQTTKEAFILAEKDDIRGAINKLIGLNGIKIPIASTILAIKFPKDFCIIDRRVLNELIKIDLQKKEWLKDYTTNSETYEKYLLYMRKTKPKDMNLRDYERIIFEKSFSVQKSS